MILYYASKCTGMQLGDCCCGKQVALLLLSEKSEIKKSICVNSGLRRIQSLKECKGKKNCKPDYWFHSGRVGPLEVSFPSAFK